jgi:polyglutamine-binding protein 1
LLLPVLYIRANYLPFSSDKPRDETDKAKCANDLPDFLKQRLRARGILKNETANKNNTGTQTVSC